MLRREILCQRKRFRRGGNRCRTRRLDTGANLVELLVSIIIGALLAGAASDMFGQLQRLATATHNDRIEHLVVDELLEAARSLDFAFLDQNKGSSFVFYPYLDSSTTSGNLFRDDPVVLDFLNKTWSDKVKGNRIAANLIRMDIEPASGVTDAVKVTVTFEFTDSSRYATTVGGVGRKIVKSIVVSNSGINRWSR